MMKRGKRNRFIKGVIANFCIFIILVSSFSFGALGQSEEGSNVEYPDPGMTSNNILHGFELWWENRQINSVDTIEEKLELERQYLAERYAEMRELIQDGDEDAKTAAEEAKRMYENMAAHVAEYITGENVDVSQIESGESELHKLIEFEKGVIEIQNNYLYDIKKLTDEQVEAGVIDEELAKEIVVPVEAGNSDVGDVVFEEKEQIVDSLMESVPEVEAEVIVAKVEKDEGVEGEYKEVVNEQKIGELKDRIEELNEMAKDLENSGDSEGSAALETLTANAEFNLRKCEHALENGIYGRAYGQLTSAERLVYNAERQISREGGPNPEFRGGMEYVEGLIGGKAVDVINRDIDEEVRKSENTIRYYEDKDYGDKFRDKYPEYDGYYNAEYERAKKSQELTDKLRGEGVMDKWFEELRAGGLSEPEVVAKIGERWDLEFRNVYGEEYIPPGMIRPIRGDREGEEGDDNLEDMPVWPPIEVIPIGRIDVEVDPVTGEKKIMGWRDDGESHDNVGWGGGFVSGVEYKDPVTGNIFIFSGDKYTYTTPAGVKYVETYPLLGEKGEGFNAKNDFENGDEKFSYEYRTPDGEIVKYEYSATGYEAEILGESIVEEGVAGEQEALGEQAVEDASQEGVTGDGEQVAEAEEEKVSVVYPIGVYPVEGGGGRIEVSTTGVTHVDESGLVNVLDYVPEFDIYVNSETGKVFVTDVSFHENNIIFDATTNQYKYVGPEGEWKYQGEGKWIAPDGSEVQKTYVPAPVGREEFGEYSLPSGEKWIYNEEAGAWVRFDSNGNKADSYIPAPNHYVSYDGKENRYVDYRGNVYSYEQWQRGGGSGGYGGWNWNSATGRWETADQKEEYDPVTGNYNYKGTDEGRRDYAYGRVYDSNGQEIRAYNYNDYSTRTIYNPDGTTSRYSFKDYGAPNVPSTYTDPYTGMGWTRNVDGTWSSYGSARAGTYQDGGYAKVGTKYTDPSTGDVYVVDPALGWSLNGKAVPPPSGQPSSEAGAGYGGGYSYSGGPGYYGGAASRNYNWVDKDGNTYYFPSGVDPNNPSVNKDSYKISNPYGYDPAFGTSYGGAAVTSSGTPKEGTYYSSGVNTGAGSVYVNGQWRLVDPNNPVDVAMVEAAKSSGNVYNPGYAGGYSGYSYGCANGACGGGYYGSGTAGTGGYTSYGHIQDSVTGTWRPATEAEAAAAQASGDPNYSPPGSSSGTYTGTGPGYYSGDGSYSGTYSGTYSGDGSYSGGTYSGTGTYSGDSGSYSGTTTGGSTTTSSSSTGDSGGSTGGSTSTSTSSGGDSGGSTGGSTGGDSGGGSASTSTGAFIREFEVSEYSFGDALGYMFDKIF